MRSALPALFMPTLLGALAAARPVFADGFDARGFDPPSDPWGYISAAGAKSLEPLQAHGAATFAWAHRSLRFDESRGGRAGKDVVRDLYELDAALALGLFKIGGAATEVGVLMPIILEERGFEVDEPDEILEESGAGDLRTDLKVAFLDRDEDALGLAARAWVRWPTGRGTELASNERAAAGIEGSIERRIGFLRTGLNLGYEWLDGEAHVGPIEADDKLLLSVGLGIAPLSDIRGFEPLEIIFETRAAARAEKPFASEEESPVEVGGALRWTGTFVALVGAGAGLNRGAGAPDARIYCTIGFTF